VHAATLHLIPILAAEKSKVPFYIAGGLLVAWAFALGLRRGDFPTNEGGQRVIVVVTAALVLITAATAIITSGGAKNESSSAAATVTASTAGTPPPAEPAPAATTTATSTTSSTSSAAKPTATTGTPNPPSSPAAAAPSAPLALAADPSGGLAYNTKQLSAKAGKVTIDFANGSPVPHNVAIAEGGKTLGQTPIKSGSATLTLNLKPGTYTFYCAAPGHRQAGMEGTLTVS
jgi:plastocyanin